MSLLQTDPLIAANEVWLRAQQNDSIYWCSIMITLFSFFVPFDLDTAVPVLKLILMEKYIGVNHEENFIGMIRGVKKHPGNDYRNFKCIISEITELRLLNNRLRYYGFVEHSSLERHKVTIQYLQAKNHFMASIFQKEEQTKIIFSLLEKEIKQTESWLNLDLFNIPQRFIGTLAYQRFFSSFVPLNDYPPPIDWMVKNSQYVAKSLWGYSHHQTSRIGMKKFLQAIFTDVTADLVTIDSHLKGIGIMIKKEWYHQDFMINMIAMQYQLLSLEVYLENFKSANPAYGIENARYQLLKKCKDLYRSLEKGSRETAQLIQKSCTRVLSYETGMKVTVSNYAGDFGLIINIYFVKANTTLDPVIDCFGGFSGYGKMSGNFYISNNYDKITDFLQSCTDLVKANKEVVLPIEKITNKIIDLFNKKDSEII